MSSFDYQITKKNNTLEIGTEFNENTQINIKVKINNSKPPTASSTNYISFKFVVEVDNTKINKIKFNLAAGFVRAVNLTDKPDEDVDFAYVNCLGDNCTHFLQKFENAIEEATENYEFEYLTTKKESMKNKITYVSIVDEYEEKLSFASTLNRKKKSKLLTIPILVKGDNVANGQQLLTDRELTDEKLQEYFQAHREEGGFNFVQMMYSLGKQNYKKQIKKVKDIVPHNRFELFSNMFEFSEAISKYKIESIRVSIYGLSSKLVADETSKKKIKKCETCKLRIYISSVVVKERDGLYDEIEALQNEAGTCNEIETEEESNTESEEPNL